MGGGLRRLTLPSPSSIDSIALAAAHPNLALVKYWGNRDESLRLPQNGSLSITLAGLHTVTRVRFNSELTADRLDLQGRPADPRALERVVRHLDLVRDLAGIRAAAEVTSASDFPTGAGLASSASAFAALSVAASQAGGLRLNPTELSRLARRGSGSACRSIFGGFVEWTAGQDDQTSFASSLAPPEHWPLADVIAVVHPGEKAVGSSEGHRLAGTSPEQARRLEGAEARLDECRNAILARDFPALAAIVEDESDLMHAVMESSSPPLHYRRPESYALMSAVRAWRSAGSNVCYTLDAGPNVHCICPLAEAAEIEARLRRERVVQRVITAGIGGGARLLENDDPLTALL